MFQEGNKRSEWFKSYKGNTSFWIFVRRTEINLYRFPSTCVSPNFGGLYLNGKEFPKNFDVSNCLEIIFLQDKLTYFY